MIDAMYASEFSTEVEVDDADNNRSGKAFIKWKIEIEMRSWGVKSIFPVVYDQEFKGWLTKNDVDDPEHEEPQFMIKDVEIEDADSFDGGTLYPHLLVIQDGKFTLAF